MAGGLVATDLLPSLGGRFQTSKTRWPRETSGLACMAPVLPRSNEGSRPAQDPGKLSRVPVQLSSMPMAPRFLGARHASFAQPLAHAAFLAVANISQCT